jgi:osmoprotectant transport system permease protein
VMDAFLVLLERLLTPWTRAVAKTDKAGLPSAAERLSDVRTGGASA